MLDLMQILSKHDHENSRIFQPKGFFSIKAQTDQTSNIWNLEYHFLNFQLPLVPIRIGWAKLFYSAV